MIQKKHKHNKIIFLFLILVSGVLLLSPSAFADDQCASITDPSARVACYSQKVADTQGQEKTLSSQIQLINNQIFLTQSQIEVTQDKLDRLNSDIASISGKIDSIQGSLSQVSSVLANRIVQTYITGRTDPIIYLLSSQDLNDLLQRLSYLQIVQKHDKKLMFQMATTKKNYNDQKDLLTEKKKQVEALSLQLKNEQAQLNRQNQEKQALLDITKSDEIRYQQLLTQAQQELAALQASTFVGKRDVKKGDIIGLMGSTGFSTGPHLHFGVYNLSQDQAASFNYNSGTNNPLSFLKSRTVNVDKGACYDHSGVTTVGSGSWDWPMNSPGVSQCYGKTPYSFVYSNGLHEGLDMYDLSDLTIHTVDDGVAYSYRDSGNGFGNNVRVFHKDSKMTLYLHMQ